MKVLNVFKYVFSVSFLTSLITVPIVFHSVDVNDQKPVQHIYVDEIIENKLNSISDAPGNVGVATNFLGELASEIRNSNDEINIQKSVTFEEETEVEISYEDILASTLEMFDLSDVAIDDEELPEDVSLQEVMNEFVEFAKEDASLQYQNAFNNIEGLPVMQKRSQNINDIQVGNILHYWKPGGFVGNLVLHTAMVTGIYPESKNKWEITDAMKSDGVKIKYYDDDDEFETHLKSHNIDVLTPRVFQRHGKWWQFWKWRWNKPSIAEFQTMATRMKSKDGKKYEIVPNRFNDSWYCSELVWYATRGVSKYTVPSSLEWFNPLWTLPVKIFTSSKTEVLSSWR